MSPATALPETRRVRATRAAPPATTRAAAPAAPFASDAPPFVLPGSHFGAALLFWLVGAAGLVWVAPDLARGLFPLPRVAAVTHLFTLGWITTAILGALYQFLPVALRTPIRSQRAAWLTLALYVPGLALFLAGFLAARFPVMLTGAVLFGAGLLIFAGNLTATLMRARERSLTWWALAGATVFLVATVVLGASLAANLEYHYLAEKRFLALGVHLHVALAGWVMLVVVGVGQRLLPMFLLSHGAPEWPGAVALGMLASGTTLLLALHHGLNAFTIPLIATLMAGGCAVFLFQAFLFYRHSRKPALDPGLRLAAGGLTLLLLGLLLVPGYLLHGLTLPRLATGYVTALVAAFSLFVAGHFYKILPFLVWFHRFGPLVGRREVPKVADLYSARWGNTAAALLVAGAVGLVGSILFGVTETARPTAGLFAAGALILTLQMLAIARRRPA
jgi:hypothetical protein